MGQRRTASTMSSAWSATTSNSAWSTKLTSSESRIKLSGDSIRSITSEMRPWKPASWEMLMMVPPRRTKIESCSMWIWANPLVKNEGTEGEERTWTFALFVSDSSSALDARRSARSLSCFAT